MKYFGYIFLTLLSCSAEKRDLSNLYILSSSKEIVIHNEIVYFKNQRFNGCLYQLMPNKKDTLQIQFFKNGIYDGIFKKWYSNKQLMEYRVYKNGKKNGIQVTFWKNGYKRFEYNAKNDTYDGEMSQWTNRGQLYHLAHYSNGQEEGSQKMWYENGKLRANYVIINGKRYGLLGTKKCKNVSDFFYNNK